PTARRRTLPTRFDETSEPQQVAGVASDDALLVGGDDPGAHRALHLRDDGPAGGIGLRVVDQAEPGRALAHLGAHGRGVLADTAGEDERVDAAQRRRQRAEVADDGIAVLFDRVAG